jgi:DNA-binding MarR family transcriptional regulator
MTQAQSYEKNNLLQSVADVSKSWYKLAEKELSQFDLTISELRVLRMLISKGPCSMIIVAREQRMTPGGMTGLVDHLENRGLLVRARSKEDRRVINIEITKEGRKAVSRASLAYQEFLERSLENLSKAEVESFVRTLSKMISSVVQGERRRLVSSLTKEVVKR